MKFVKTSELSGAALDWAVVWASEKEKSIRVAPAFLHGFHPSTNWAQGGPVIERENISIVRCDDDYQNFPGKWLAERGAQPYSESTEHQSHDPMIQISIENDGSRFAKDGPFYGETPLIAAMRCYVAGKLGDKIEIPEELV